MDWIVTQRQRLHSLFGVFFAPEVSAAILPLTRSALRVGGEGTAVRLGGPPLLPPATTWPSWADRPLDFLALLDFGKLAAAFHLDELPSTGQAVFYHSRHTPRSWESSPADRDGCRVFTGELVEVTPPPESTAYPARHLGATPFLSLPAPQEPVLQKLEITYSGILPVYEQLYDSWQQHLWPDEPVHQIGGWPILPQRPITPDGRHTAATPADPASASPATTRGAGTPADPATSSAPSLSAGTLADPATSPAADLADTSRPVADEWRPILQLDSDDTLGWHWGDAGHVHFGTSLTTPLTEGWLTLQPR